MIPLLEFMFDFLQKSHGKIIDPTKFDIQSFEPDELENAEKETQWLLVHLYYLCLRHLANMTKNWWIDAKKRVKGPVEDWTERYVSSLSQFQRPNAKISNSKSRSRLLSLATPSRAWKTGLPAKIQMRSVHWLLRSPRKQLRSSPAFQWMRNLHQSQFQSLSHQRIRCILLWWWDAAESLSMRRSGRTGCSPFRESSCSPMVT